MLKKTITFNNLDGKSLTEDFYFNLTKAEAVEFQFSHSGGLEEHIRRIIAAEDMRQVISLFKELIVKTVGRRSEDGRRFLKTQEITDDFVQTEAYSELFMELATNAEFAVLFMKGIMPPDMQETFDDVVQKESIGDGTVTTEASATLEVPSWVTEGRTPTPEEVRNASSEQLALAFRRREQSEAAKTVTAE